MISYNLDYGPVIAQGSGGRFDRDNSAVIAHVREPDTLMGGFIFFNYTHESIWVDVASFQPNWLNREMIFQLFAYPFLQLEVKRMFGQIATTNFRSIRFAYRLGFKGITIIPKVYRGGVDALVIGIERDDCKYIPLRPAQHGGSDG